MTDDEAEGEVQSDWFRDLLDRLGQQADDMIAGYLAQDPKTIDLVGRVGSLPGKVFDMLVSIKDQLNDDSQAALDEWEEEKAQRHREMFARYEEYSAPHRAMMEWAEQQSTLQRHMYELAESPLARAMREWQEQQDELYRPMREWQEREAERNREMWALLEQSERRFRASLPPNWNNPEIEFPDLEDLEALQQQEGLPMAWVPPNHVLAELLSCKTSASRRRVVARESEAILTACRRELRRLTSEETREWRGSADEAVRAMKAGHWRAGQALAAIALDTATMKFVRSSYPDAVLQSRKAPGGVRVSTPPGFGERSLPTWRDVDYPRALLVLHSIYGAFTEFNPLTGRPVPTQFTRHGTVHSISRRQYTKANALIALMHVVGLLCLIEDD